MARSVSHDVLHDYLQQIGGFPVLTADDEVALAMRIEAGEVASAALRTNGASGEDLADLQHLTRSGKRAYDAFMCANLKLVVSIAKHYTGHGLALIDLIQNGNIGLDRAVRQFDYTRGFRFSTSAVWWIRQPITQSLASGARTIRIPVHTLEAINRLRALENHLAAELGRDPRTAELADAAGMEPSAVRRLLRARLVPLSLDADVEADSSPERTEQFVDADAASTEEIAEGAAMRAAVRHHVRELSERDRTVICLRFGFDGREPMTLEQIGGVLGVSKQRIGQIEAAVLERLRTPELAGYRDAA